jgi:hypothetical protein
MNTPNTPNFARSEETLKPPLEPKHARIIREGVSNDLDLPQLDFTSLEAASFLDIHIQDAIFTTAGQEEATRYASTKNPVARKFKQIIGWLPREAKSKYTSLMNLASSVDLKLRGTSKLEVLTTFLKPIFEDKNLADPAQLKNCILRRLVSELVTSKNNKKIVGFEYLSGKASDLASSLTPLIKGADSGNILADLNSYVASNEHEIPHGLDSILNSLSNSIISARQTYSLSQTAKDSLLGESVSRLADLAKENKGSTFGRKDDMAGSINNWFLSLGLGTVESVTGLVRGAASKLNSNVEFQTTMQLVKPDIESFLKSKIPMGTDFESKEVKNLVFILSQKKALEIFLANNQAKIAKNEQASVQAQNPIKRASIGLLRTLGDLFGRKDIAAMKGNVVVNEMDLLRTLVQQNSILEKSSQSANIAGLMADLDAELVYDADNLKKIAEEVKRVQTKVGWKEVGSVALGAGRFLATTGVSFLAYRPLIGALGAVSSVTGNFTADQIQSQTGYEIEVLRNTGFGGQAGLDDWKDVSLSDSFSKPLGVTSTEIGTEMAGQVAMGLGARAAYPFVGAASLVEKGANVVSSVAIEGSKIIQAALSPEPAQATELARTAAETSGEMGFQKISTLFPATAEAINNSNTETGIQYRATSRIDDQILLANANTSGNEYILLPDNTTQTFSSIQVNGKSYGITAAHGLQRGDGTYFENIYQDDDRTSKKITVVGDVAFIGDMPENFDSATAKTTVGNYYFSPELGRVKLEGKAGDLLSVSLASLDKGNIGYFDDGNQSENDFTFTLADGTVIKPGSSGSIVNVGENSYMVSAVTAGANREARLILSPIRTSIDPQTLITEKGFLERQGLFKISTEAYEEAQTEPSNYSEPVEPQPVVETYQEQPVYESTTQNIDVYEEPVSNDYYEPASEVSEPQPVEISQAVPSSSYAESVATEEQKLVEKYANPEAQPILEDKIKAGEDVYIQQYSANPEPADTAKIKSPEVVSPNVSPAEVLVAKAQPEITAKTPDSTVRFGDPLPKTPVGVNIENSTIPFGQSLPETQTTLKPTLKPFDPDYLANIDNALNGSFTTPEVQSEAVANSNTDSPHGKAVWDAKKGESFEPTRNQATVDTANAELARIKANPDIVGNLSADGIRKAIKNPNSENYQRSVNYASQLSRLGAQGAALNTVEQEIVRDYKVVFGGKGGEVSTVAQSPNPITNLNNPFGQLSNLDRQAANFQNQTSQVSFDPKNIVNPALFNNGNPSTVFDPNSQFKVADGDIQIKPSGELNLQPQQAALSIPSADTVKNAQNGIYSSIDGRVFIIGKKFNAEGKAISEGVLEVNELSQLNQQDLSVDQVQRIRDAMIEGLNSQTNSTLSGIGSGVDSLYSGTRFIQSGASFLKEQKAVAEAGVNLMYDQAGLFTPSQERIYNNLVAGQAIDKTAFDKVFLETRIRDPRDESGQTLITGAKYIEEMNALSVEQKLDTAKLMAENLGDATSTAFGSISGEQRGATKFNWLGLILGLAGKSLSLGFNTNESSRLNIISQSTLPPDLNLDFQSPESFKASLNQIAKNIDGKLSVSDIAPSERLKLEQMKSVLSEQLQKLENQPDLLAETYQQLNTNWNINKNNDGTTTLSIPMLSKVEVQDDGKITLRVGESGKSVVIDAVTQPELYAAISQNKLNPSQVRELSVLVQASKYDNLSLDITAISQNQFESYNYDKFAKITPAIAEYRIFDQNNAPITKSQVPQAYLAMEMANKYLASGNPDKAKQILGMVLYDSQSGKPSLRANIKSEFQELNLSNTTFTKLETGQIDVLSLSEVLSKVRANHLTGLIQSLEENIRGMGQTPEIIRSGLSGATTGGHLMNRPAAVVNDPKEFLDARLKSNNLVQTQALIDFYKTFGFVAPELVGKVDVKGHNRSFAEKNEAVMNSIPEQALDLAREKISENTRNTTLATSQFGIFGINLIDKTVTDGGSTGISPFLIKTIVDTAASLLRIPMITNAGTSKVTELGNVSVSFNPETGEISESVMKEAAALNIVDNVLKSNSKIKEKVQELTRGTGNNGFSLQQALTEAIQEEIQKNQGYLTVNGQKIPVDGAKMQDLVNNYLSAQLKITYQKNNQASTGVAGAELLTNPFVEIVTQNGQITSLPIDLVGEVQAKAENYLKSNIDSVKQETKWSSRTDKAVNSLENIFKNTGIIFESDNTIIKYRVVGGGESVAVVNKDTLVNFSPSQLAEVVNTGAGKIFFELVYCINVGYLEVINGETRLVYTKIGGINVEPNAELNYGVIETELQSATQVTAPLPQPKPDRPKRENQPEPEKPKQPEQPKPQEPVKTPEVPRSQTPTRPDVPNQPPQGPNVTPAQPPSPVAPNAPVQPAVPGQPPAVNPVAPINPNAPAIGVPTAPPAPVTLPGNVPIAPVSPSIPGAGFPTTLPTPGVTPPIGGIAPSLPSVPLPIGPAPVPTIPSNIPGVGF